MKFFKIFKALSAGYVFYKANEEEIDSATRVLKRQVKKVRGTKKELDKPE